MAKTRILLVDDDRSMLSALDTMVRDAGYEAAMATNWSDALRVFRSYVPDLILLDIMMPTIDGFKLARILKEQSTDRFVPIILITGLGDIESKKRGLASGADDFLTKPVAPVELQLRLRSMLRIKELTDDLQRANNRLAELASTDPLTQLKNRRVIYEHLEREFARARRYSHPLAVFMIDIDHFKAINDGHGHSIGDAVLRMVSAILERSTRETDLVGRYGGEEFIVLAPETAVDAAVIMGERIRLNVAAETERHDQIPSCTISVGVTTTESVKVVHFEDLIHLADEALYSAKRRGRNRVVPAQ
jgi:diguanylate cyclase (GGDEF)-like protein